MYIYKAQRGKGKTLSLLYTSMYTGYPIVCLTQTERENIVQMAQNLNITIKTPYTIEEFMRSRGQRHNENILIDNLDIMLPKILNDYFGCNVCGVTINNK